MNFAEFIIDQLKDKRIDFSKQDPPEFVKASQLLTHYITEFGKECDEAASARTFWLKSRMASLYDDLYAASRETKKALLLLECMEDKDKDKTHVEIPLPHCKNTVCVLSKESIKAYQTREELQSSFQDMSNVNEEIAKLAISKYSYVLTSNDGSDPQRLKKLEMLRKAYSFLKDSIGCVKCLIEELAEHEHSPKGYLVKASSILEDIKAQISGVEKGTLDLQLEETLLFTLYKILGKCGTENVPKQKSVQDIRVTSWELVIMLIDITPLGSSMSLSTRIDFFSDLHNYLKENNLCGSSTWIIIRFIKTLTEFPAPKNCISCKEWDDWEKRVIIPVTGKGFKEWIKMFGCCMYWITGKVLLDQHDLNVHKADKVDKEKQKMLQEPWLLARFFFVTSFLMDENTQMKNALIDSKDLLIKTFGSDNYPYKAYVDEVLGAGGKPGPDLLTKTKSLLTKAKKASVDIENYADNRFEAFARKYVYAAFVDMGNVKDSKVLCDLLLHALYINPVNVEYWELLGKCYQDELSNAIKVKTKPNKKEADLLFRNTMACLSNLIMGLRKAEVEAAEAEEEEEFFGNFFSLGIISYWMEKFEDASKSRYENSKGAFILCTRLKPNEWEPFLMIGRCEEKKDFDISVVLPIYHRALDLAIAADPDHSLCDECLYRVYATRVKYVMKGGDITVLNSVEKTNFTSCEDVLTDALKNGFEPILSSECSHYRALKMACKIWLHGPPLLQSPEKAERALSSNIRLLKNPPFQNLIKTGKDSLSNYMVMPWDHASYKEKILLFYVEALSRCESLDTLNNLFNSPICEDYPDVFKSAKAEMFKVISGEIDQSLLSTTTASSSQLVDADDASDHSKNLLKYTYNLVVKDSSYKELLTKAYRNYSLTTYKKEPDQETTPGDIIKICEGLGFKKRSSSYCHVNSKSKKSKVG